MPTFPSDRLPRILEQQYPAVPLPPLNLFCSFGFLPGVLDLRWSSPAELPANSRFNMTGVNIYRSFDSEYGPYFRLNTIPIGANFYRDRTEVVVALNEDVSGSFISRGPTTSGDARYVFRTAHKPIDIFSSLGAIDITNLNVHVTVNGQAAFVESIRANLGEVELRKFPSFDVANQRTTQPVLPTNPSDVVLATYRYRRNEVKTDLGQRVFYRVTTVATDLETGDLIETPLDRASQANNQEVEKLDYMWREAIRRQRWLLDHGGERVKLFIRRAVGNRCGCYSNLHKQPSSDCQVCFGTGILGGYDGPYDVSIAPDDGPKKISQSARGRSMEHMYDTWMLPSPLVSQRDFIVKLNGDRYGIGPVRMPSNRGMQLQQFFPISHLDESDIRYRVPVMDSDMMYAPHTNWSLPDGGSATPMITERDRIPDEREERGATTTWANTYRR